MDQDAAKVQEMELRVMMWVYLGIGHNKSAQIL